MAFGVEELVLCGIGGCGVFSAKGYAVLNAVRVISFHLDGLVLCFMLYRDFFALRIMLHMNIIFCVAVFIVHT